MLKRTIQLLQQQGIEATLVATDAPGSATFQVREQIDLGCELIIAAGGDGTINEVANGMLHTGIPLGILPGGTANVLAREMKMPRTLLDAAAQLSTFQPQTVGVGMIRMGESERRSFLCMAGCGLDAEIVSRLDVKLKAATGKFAYYVTGFSQVFRPLREFPVIVDGVPYQASFALISRVRNYGGDLEIARGASLLKADFEVVLFRGTFAARYLPYLVGVAIGQAAHMPGCTVLRARRVECPSGNGIFAQIDGELAGQLPVTVEILPDALTLLAPPKFLAREQAAAAVPVCA